MTKQELRSAVKEKRSKLPPDEKKLRDRAIVKQIAASQVFREASSLLIYAPTGSEINLLPLARLARERGIPVAFPRCDTATNTMQFYILEPEARLREGAYGIPEPPESAPLCPLDEHTLCILPALTFDPTGARLGYGKGYYDRFLARFPGVRAGAVYEQLLVKRVPTEPHDRPVALLFTEHECWDCRTAPPATPPKRPSILDRAKRFIAEKGAKGAAKARALTVYEGDILGENPPATPHAPLILTAAIFALLILSRAVDTLVTSPAWEWVTVILLQLAVFAAPALVYVFKYRGPAYWDKTDLYPPKLSRLWFLFCMLIVMISGALLTEIMTGGISSLTGTFTLYDTFVARATGGAQILYLIVAYAFLPALCEELVFRWILLTEFRGFGATVSLLVSALLFAMLHFSLPLFPTYLFLGLLLGAARFATRSIWAPVLLHLCYNLFCLFGQPYLSAFYVNAGSTRIFLFCLLVLFLLFAAFATGEARKFYHLYARDHYEDTHVTPPIKKMHLFLWRAVRSPAAVICAAIWLVMAILNLV